MHFFLNGVLQIQSTFSIHSTGACGAQKLKIRMTNKKKEGEKKKRERVMWSINHMEVLVVRRNTLSSI